jgi:16S rRNA (cytosine967-C5)-methyltransferase
MGEFTAPEPGNMVLDACASPGGKTLHLAAIMKNKGRIIACDIHPHRVKNMKDNIKRTAFDIIKCIQQNMTVKDDKYIDKFDIVLVDAPCSGLGTAQRRPEIKFQYEADESLYKLQDMILENCADYVKPGGKLIYGTCTLFKEENRDVIERLLSKRDDYEPAGEKMILPDGRSGGFYMAGLARKK